MFLTTKYDVIWEGYGGGQSSMAKYGGGRGKILNWAFQLKGK